MDRIRHGWHSHPSDPDAVGKFREPGGVAIDFDDRIWIADRECSRLVRISSMAGAGWLSVRVRTVAIGIDDPNSAVLVCALGSGDIGRHAGSTGALTEATAIGALTAPAAVQLAGSRILRWTPRSDASSRSTTRCKMSNRGCIWLTSARGGRWEWWYGDPTTAGPHLQRADALLGNGAGRAEVAHSEHQRGGARQADRGAHPAATEPWDVVCLNEVFDEDGRDLLEQGSGASIRTTSARPTPTIVVGSARALGRLPDGRIRVGARAGADRRSRRSWLTLGGQRADALQPPSVRRRARPRRRCCACRRPRHHGARPPSPSSPTCPTRTRGQRHGGRQGGRLRRLVQPNEAPFHVMISHTQADPLDDIGEHSDVRRKQLEVAMELLERSSAMPGR